MFGPPQKTENQNDIIPQLKLMFLRLFCRGLSDWRRSLTAEFIPDLADSLLALELSYTSPISQPRSTASRPPSRAPSPPSPPSTL